jgi:Ankyrin repeats (many copies)
VAAPVLSRIKCRCDRLECCWDGLKSIAAKDDSARFCRHLECVKFLLGEDADPFLVDRAHLRTALHCAAAYGHAPVLRALLADELLVRLTSSHLEALAPGTYVAALMV